METKLSETICLELTVSNKKWFILFAYRPPQENNKICIFNELNEKLCKAVNSYGNIIVIGDLNIDVSGSGKDRNSYLSGFVETFSLSKLINRKTCHENLSGRAIDIMLPNRTNCFQKTSTAVTSLKDFHEMAISCLKTTFKKNSTKKRLFSEIIKSLMNKIFYKISINK